MCMQQNRNKYLPLKFFILFLITCCNSFSSHAQLLKRIKDGLKSNAESKVTQKVNDNINKGIDSLIKPHSKKKNAENKDSANNSNTPVEPDNVTENTDNTNSNSANTDSINTYNAAATNDNEPATGDAQTPQDGFISMTTSANTTFTGGSVIISGESVLYENFKSIELTIQGPYTEDANPKPIAGFTKQTKQVPLDKDGKYTSAWNAGGIDGDFILTATSSDAKATKTKKVRVNSWRDMGDIADSNIEQTTKAYNKLVKRIDDVRPNISSKDAGDLDKKMADIKDKKDAAITLFTSLNDATKKLGALIAKGTGLSPSLSANLSELNSTLSAQASDMARMDEFTNHEPSDNTICEYLVMVNEACAAFSTFSNIYGTTMVGAITNIVIDKAVPAAMGAAGESQGNNTGTPVDPDREAASKEGGKLYATSLVDAKSLTTKMGGAGLVGDLVQSVTNYFLRKYCGVYEGTIKHNYTVIFRNADHEIWWKYGVEMEAAFSLRYPKGKTGKTIKMKGNIEGNATKFTFFADAKAAVKDEMQGRDKYVEVMVLKDFLPLALPFATSQHDKMGFGAVARAIGTPAYFNIPVDADYDLDAEKIKLFINPALVDFSPIVENRELYIVLAVLPLVRWQEYPIFKAQQMIKGSFKEKNEFPMTGGKTTNPQCSDKVTRHIGKETDPFEIFLNSTFVVKKQ